MENKFAEKEKMFRELKNLSIKSLNKKERYNRIMEFSDDENSTMVIEVNTSLLTNEQGEINGALCSFNDITERKKIEEKIEEIDRLSSLGELASGLAHEIRNPLAGIKTSTQVLKGRFEDENSKKLFNNVISEIDRMNKLISDILNFARPHKPQFKLVEIKNIINETLILMEEHFKKNNITINKNFLEKELWIKIDPEQFKQILINLYMNAINAISNEGKLEITLSSNENKKIKVSIKDNGKGIAEKNIRKIFEPFYTTASTGTGLGLAVVKRLVLENKGEIRVKSEKGKGTEFIINFPKRRG